MITLQMRSPMRLSTNNKKSVRLSVCRGCAIPGRENAILSLIEAPHRFSFTSLFIMGTTFFLLMLLAFGAAYPAGIFMPTVVIGTAFGALYGQMVKYVSCLLHSNFADGANPTPNVDSGSVTCTWDYSLGATTAEFAQRGWIPHAGPYALECMCMWRPTRKLHRRQAQARHGMWPIRV